MAESLRVAGFAQVETYDPFVRHYSAKPHGRFDCLVSFEVLEHSTNPSGTIADMLDFLTDAGFIFLSTLLQPSDIDRVGLNWWYAAPRNAHVSLYSSESLEKLLQPFGFKLVSLDQSYHVLYREMPAFAMPSMTA